MARYDELVVYATAATKLGGMPQTRRPISRPASLSILFDLFAATQRIRQLVADAFEGCELRPDEYAVYSSLVDYGPQSIVQMADACGLPPTTVATYVADMEARGHAVRSMHPTDGRSRLV